MNNEHGNLYVEYNNISYNYLSHTTYFKLGLRSGCGQSYDCLESLSFYNDNGKTWNEIADMLEKNPDKWFERSV